ncbi:HesA/MoeB/ThiF family protein [Wenxinia marina]|uniref:Molybdopterin-synthase adenylyltransferase n=1 Tax=Wenxinia marina DSM 24838 TaxID=1123501 RepID=A0A0D0PH29_9RHOB|nr:HesA/MoeB/ThiF family protein [Wenxinia marina]KIQ70636.1 Dinucleotide-utilizing enzyme involved in molybdopterin and thiamine biosynthesis family 2 [Wenxinia marina DSM 24838]GGL51576.1 molybdopterin biosynthesis protein [Wenxinia marina]
MILVGAMAAAIWAVGWLTGAPVRARLIMLGLLMVAVLAGHVLLPDGHPLREATGGEAAFWLMLLAFGALVFGYRALLTRVKARARSAEAERAPAPAPGGPMGGDELRRSLRHIVLREIGGPGQAALKQAKVLVVGAGGLGSPVLEYLAAAGVGTIGVIDGDDVDETNLQRQVIHSTADVGRPKVFSAADRIAALNPHVVVRPYHRRLTGEIAADLVAAYDLVLDGTDNFETRYLVNRTCVAAGVPLVAGALTQWEGQLALWDPARGGPCYECVFPTAPDRSLVPSCAEAGVLGPLPGIVGSMMAAEAVKVIAAAGEPLRGRLMIFDALYADARVIRTRPRADCAACGGRGADAAA